MKHTEFKLKRVSGTPVSDEELIDDLKKVATSIQGKKVTQKIYTENGSFNCSTLIRRFGSWNKALTLTGLNVSNEINISDERLFENLLVLWQHYGRQPRRSELSKDPSSISQQPYNRRFGSWTASLTAFVEFANSSDIDPTTSQEKRIPKRNTGRDPSLRLRWKVLQRDHFTCCACGASPANDNSTELHVDHVIPWSKGGDTVIENLQTLCSTCNLGKSNT